MDVRPSYLRLKDAAVYCGLSVPTMMKLQAKGKGPTRIKIGRCVLFAIKHLDEWLLKNAERVHLDNAA